MIRDCGCVGKFHRNSCSDRAVVEPLRPDQLAPETTKDTHRRASIATYTGREFFPLAPRVEDIALLDIGHSLSQRCRFTGHCRVTWTVAQHSMLVRRILETWGESREVQLVGLLHDAAEAYLPDVASPLKTSLGWREIERPLEEAIAKRFGFDWPHPPAVKRADAEAFRYEHRHLMPATLWWTVPPAERDWGPIEEERPGFIRFCFMTEAAKLLALLGREA